MSNILCHKTNFMSIAPMNPEENNKEEVIKPPDARSSEQGGIRFQGHRKIRNRKSNLIENSSMSRDPGLFVIYKKKKSKH